MDFELFCDVVHNFMKELDFGLTRGNNVQIHLAAFFQQRPTICQRNHLQLKLFN